MTLERLMAATAAITLGVAGSPLVDGLTKQAGFALAPSAQAQGIIKNLFARLRGETLPDGIVKSNGRIEATQVDVSAKYAGRLAEVTVEEGSSVTKDQVIARISAPEYEAQLRAAQADVQKAKDALVAAESEIVSRQSALDFAKSDFERGQELVKNGHLTKQVFEQRKRNFESAEALDIQEIIPRRLRLSYQLEKWRQDISPFCTILSEHDLGLLSPSTNDAVRFQIMLSIHYYRVALLINGPVLTRILAESFDGKRNERRFVLILDDALPAVKNDYLAAKCLQTIIHSLCTQMEPFLNRNGAWWICNYTSECI